MLDHVIAERIQRSHGVARIGHAVSGDRTRLTDLHQSGSAKVMLPRVEGRVPEVVFLNTSGGLTGGDTLSFGLSVGAGARITATTQTAERAYQSTGSAARVSISATVGPGGHLAWLPQETILFEDCNLLRRTEIDLDATATCLMAESVVLGRRAMGESPRHARLEDRRLIRRQGRPVWAESLCIDSGFLTRSANPALLGGAAVFTVIALVAPGAADVVEPLRRILDEPGCTAAASGWDGKCVLRILASDGWPLRRQIIRALTVLHPDPLPRVWQYYGASP